MKTNGKRWCLTSSLSESRPWCATRRIQESWPTLSCCCCCLWSRCSTCMFSLQVAASIPTCWAFWVACRGPCWWPGPASSTRTPWLRLWSTSSSWSFPNGKTATRRCSVSSASSVAGECSLSVSRAGSGQILCC